MKIQSSLWFENEGRAFFGKGRIELLERIDRLGSISKAARAMKMSYKAAWDAVNEMNQLSEEPIVVRESGGKGGGGTRLTAKGREYIRTFKEISALQGRLLELLGEEAEDLRRLHTLRERLTLQTSARNQYLGRVVLVETTPVACDVTLDLGEGMVLRAEITHRSAETMGVGVGENFFALIKSNWVGLEREAPQRKINAFEGEIVRIEEDGRLCEVTLGVSGERRIVSVIATERWNRLDLDVGARAFALIEPSDVLLAR